MKTFGLIGYPLSHSFSKDYFTEKFRHLDLQHNVRYENFPITEIGHLTDLIRENSELAGLNVTIPYKVSVIPYMDELTSEARVVGAVNTIRISRSKISGEAKLVIN